MGRGKISSAQANSPREHAKKPFIEGEAKPAADTNPAQGTIVRVSAGRPSPDAHGNDQVFFQTPLF
jgi:hypothetical protein